MPNVQMMALAVVQALILLALAPFMTGVSRVIRARMHSRVGPGVMQDYRDFFKLMKRQDVSSNASGAVFRLTPCITLCTMLVVAMALPVLTTHSPIRVVADLFIFAYLFAVARFFFSLSGIDSGSSFAGVGGSRELMLGVLVEPTMILSLLVVALVEGSTNLGSISTALHSEHTQTPIAVFLAAVAFAFAVFIEMGKLPFDMAEAEQELQEGPLTEYSGPSLALMKLGLGLKKMVLAVFFLNIFLPIGVSQTGELPSLLLALVLLPIKLIAVFLIVGIIENAVARVRYVQTSQITWIGFGVAVLAFVFYLAGL